MAWRFPPIKSMRTKPTCSLKRRRNTRLADWLACPSDFVVETFLNEGFPLGRAHPSLLRLRRRRILACSNDRPGKRPFTMLFVESPRLGKACTSLLRRGFALRQAPTASSASPARFFLRTARSSLRCSPTRASRSLVTASDIPEANAASSTSWYSRASKRDRL